MIHTTANAHRVVLEIPKTGRRLPRIGDDTPGSRYSLDRSTRDRRHAAQARQIVERDAFPGEQRSGRPSNLCQAHTAADAAALFDEWQDGDRTL